MRAFIIIILAACTIIADAQTVLSGNVTRAQLAADAEFKDAYAKEYGQYKPQIPEQLQQKLSSKKLLIVMGTWCADSKMQVPRLLKILDAANFPQQQLTIIAVNDKKSEPHELVKKYHIRRVPTFIVMNMNGKILGRIIEKPGKTIEEDLGRILAKGH
jgi:thiol-disulfide isomerase/thioredoxin